jgi:nicotinamidase-related amidase
VDGHGVEGVRAAFSEATSVSPTQVDTLSLSDGDVVLLVDVLDDFAHEDGEDLLRSLAERHEKLAALLSEARERGVPIVFANDTKGQWNSDVRELVRRALAGPGGDLIRALVPESGERFVTKPRYSAFDHTPLELILEELNCEHLFIAGMTTEGCVAQSAIAARERGLKVSVVAEACAAVNPAHEETALRYLVDVVGVRLAEVEIDTPRG